MLGTKLAKLMSGSKCWIFLWCLYYTH